MLCQCILNVTLDRTITSTEQSSSSDRVPLVQTQTLTAQLRVKNGVALSAAIVPAAQMQPAGAHKAGDHSARHVPLSNLPASPHRHACRTDPLRDVPRELTEDVSLMSSLRSGRDRDRAIAALSSA